MFSLPPFEGFWLKRVPVEVGSGVKSSVNGGSKSIGRFERTECHTGAIDSSRARTNCLQQWIRRIKALPRVPPTDRGTYLSGSIRSASRAHDRRGDVRSASGLRHVQRRRGPRASHGGAKKARPVLRRTRRHFRSPDRTSLWLLHARVLLGKGG